jgi:hypothetical protein
VTRETSKGEAGATSVRVVTGQWETVAADSWGNATASCDAGERATGGSASWNGGESLDVTGLQGAPVSTSGTPTGWSASAYNRDADNNNVGAFQVRAIVICASP